MATAESFSATLAEMARRNVESTLVACDKFRRWHRENFILKRPTREQVSEHAMDVRILLLMLRWLQATLADNEQAPESWKAFEALLDTVVARQAHLDRERLKRAVHHAHRRWQRG